MAKHEGPCPCCDFVGILTRHHIYPKRIYGRQHNRQVFILCRKCHNELETHIPYQRMTHDFYQQIVHVFLEELCPNARRRNG